MSKYLLIESRDPFESQDVRYFYELAVSLARDDNQVTLFLVQNGVLGARAGEHASAFAELTRAGVEILADDFAARARDPRGAARRGGHPGRHRRRHRPSRRGSQDPLALRRSKSCPTPRRA